MMDLLERMGALTSGEEGSDRVDARAGVAAVALAGEKAGGRHFRVQEKVRGSSYFCFLDRPVDCDIGRLLFVSCSCHVAMLSCCPVLAMKARNAYIVSIPGLFAFACTTPLLEAGFCLSPFPRMCVLDCARMCAPNAVTFVVS